MRISSFAVAALLTLAACGSDTPAGPGGSTAAASGAGSVGGSGSSGASSTTASSAANTNGIDHYATVLELLRSTYGFCVMLFSIGDQDNGLETLFFFRKGIHAHGKRIANYSALLGHCIRRSR